ncbi:MAG: ABC transporter ATP-binding protein [Luteibaculaceae bacterium]
MEILKAKNLSKAYNTNVALNNISFSLNKGDIIGLLGPNGAGKTSLIRIITKILDKDSGELLYLDKPVEEYAVDNIGYLPEERGLYPQLTVVEHLIFLGRLKGMSKENVKKAIDYWVEKLEVSGFKNKKIKELSKGMAQKVQFIAAVLHNPDFLILDEPFSGFDPVNANLIKKEIIELKAQGKTIMLSTHNMNSVEEICDTLILIHQGNILLNGKVSAVKQQYTKKGAIVRYKGSAISFSTALWIHFKIEDTATDKETGITTAQLSFATDATINTLANCLHNAVEIISINPVEPSLNDIFIEQVSAKATN